MFCFLSFLIHKYITEKICFFSSHPKSIESYASYIFKEEDELLEDLLSNFLRSDFLRSAVVDVLGTWESYQPPTASWRNLSVREQRDFFELAP